MRRRRTTTDPALFGEPIEAVRSGLQSLLSALRADPYALETAHLSVITFGSEATQVVPLTDLLSFQPPELVASGMTAMGDALRLVGTCRDREVKSGSATSKGDWKPLVFIMTDGMATDDFERGLAEFSARKWGVTVACAAGAGAETSQLLRITEIVAQLDISDTEAFKAFFKWVSASISTASASVGTGVDLAKGDQLPPPPPEINVVGV